MFSRLSAKQTSPNFSGQDIPVRLGDMRADHWSSSRFIGVGATCPLDNFYMYVRHKAMIKILPPNAS